MIRGDPINRGHPINRAILLLLVGIVSVPFLLLWWGNRGPNYKISPAPKEAEYQFENKNKTFTASFLAKDTDKPWVRFEVKPGKAGALRNQDSPGSDNRTILEESEDELGNLAMAMALVTGNGPLAKVGKSEVRDKKLSF